MLSMFAMNIKFWSEVKLLAPEMIIQLHEFVTVHLHKKGNN